MSDDARAELTDLVRQAVAAAWESGCPVASNVDEITRVAVRRWQSGGRRRVDLASMDARVEDLAKGLIASDKNPYLGREKEDYRWLARQIADAIGSSFESPSNS